MSQAATADMEPWIATFDEEVDYADGGELEDVFAAALKEFLLADGDSAAADAARRIDGIHEEYYLPSDPFMKYVEDKGMGGFLNSFWELVFTLAKVVPFNNPGQDKLVQLILELRKLPPRQFKIWKSDYLVWTREPVFGSTMESNWNGNHPSDANETNDGDGKDSFQRICDDWVNFSSFLARSTEAGLNGDYYKYAIVDIGEGLDEDMPRGPMRDCKVMVAAQYILLAGRGLDDYYYKDHVNQWKGWAERLGEISRQESGNTPLASATAEARNYLVSRHPELFPADTDA